MRLLRTRAELLRWRRLEPDRPLHFVPTMGSLHAGHQCLLRRAGKPLAGRRPRVLLSVFVTAVIVFQATIAEQQLRLDALTTDLRLAEAHHDDLRQQRAELLMPTRLREEAVMMGMYQGMSTEFLEIPADVVAEVMASTSRMNPLFADPSPAVASAGAIAQSEQIEAQRP